MGAADAERGRQGDGARRRPGRALRAAVLVLPALAAACARPPAEPAPLVRAAIEARGGPLEGFVRRSELRVHYGFPGRWEWELAWRRPDRFRLTLETTGDDQTFVSDGRTLRTFLGGRLVTEAPADRSCFPSLARWIAVAGLDALEGPHFSWRELPARALSEGAARGAEAHCAAAPDARYRLLFDASLRLVELAGPVEIPTLGPAQLVARFSDFRRVGDVRLPHRIDYRRDAERFAEETVGRWQPHPELGPEAFSRPP